RVRFLATIATMVGGLAVAGSAHAIVIQNGASDSAYINLGNSASYNSVGQIYGTDSSGAFAASGVVIAQNWVLTAAHVTSGAQSLTFFLDSGGSWDSFATRGGIAADRWYSYSKWTGNLTAGYDIGLFHLSTAVGCGALLSSNGGCAAERYGGASELGHVRTEGGLGLTGTGSTGAGALDRLQPGGEKKGEPGMRNRGRCN